jgi:hypothetical protein
LGLLALTAIAAAALARAIAADDVPAPRAPDVTEPPGAVLQQPQTGTTPPPEKRRYQLKPTRDGGYAYEGPDFNARIAPDGTVSFSRPGIQLAPAGPDPRTVGIDAITPQDPIGGAPIAVPSGPGIRFDATDEYLRAMGKDPVRQQKAEFLAATFDLRINMTARANRARTRAALDELPAWLDRIWHDPRFTPAERRHLLAAMWDDLAPGPDGDAARAVIRSFAQQHLTAQEAASFR